MWSDGFRQMNSLWLTFEVEPLTSAELNDRLPMCAKHIQFDVHVYHKINFPLEPGIDDNCVVILYIQTILKYKLLWIMVHCVKQLWRYCIYKGWVTHHHIIVSVANCQHQFPPGICADGPLKSQCSIGAACHMYMYVILNTVVRFIWRVLFCRIADG